jgi:hypothetical protein
VRLAVTIDTEADSQWEYGIPLTTRNVAFWDPFQELCERHGVRPTYLIASEIVADDKARELLQAWSGRGAAEIGAHLHPWSTPPFADKPGLRFNDPAHAFPCQLPTELLGAKIATLTAEIAAAFGARPTSYRAGRFGLDTRGAGFLADEGYLIDSSLTPLSSWRGHPGLDGVGGPDFRHHSPWPFRIAGAGVPGLLEVPVTVLTTYAMLRRPAMLDLYRSLPVRAIRKLFLRRWLLPQPMWLTPDPRYGADDLGRVWQCAAAAGLADAVMIFHSSELMPGGSPFRRDSESVRELLACLDAFFGFAARHGAGFVTLTALGEALAAGPPLATRAL